MTISHLAQDRNLSILLLLAASKRHTMHEVVLRKQLYEIGHAVSLEVMRDSLIYLSDIELLACETKKVWAAQLTQRGLDVAQGRCKAYGVAEARGRSLTSSDTAPSREERLLELVANAHRVSLKKVAQVGNGEEQDDAILQSLTDVFCSFSSETPRKTLAEISALVSVRRRPYSKAQSQQIVAATRLVAAQALASLAGQADRPKRSKKAGVQR